MDLAGRTLRTAVLGLVLGACSAPGGESGTPRPGAEGVRLPARGALLVESSLRLAGGEHLRPDAGEQGLIHIRGRRGLVLDLGGAELLGQAPGGALERAAGFGVLIEDCDRVTVRGGGLGGFLGCVVVRNSTDVVLEDLSFDGFRAARLRGTAAASDPADLLDPAALAPAEWLARYGAAVAIVDSARVTVRRSSARRGQNGVLLVRSEACEVYDNDFSFLSGWGVALAASSNNRVSHNRLHYVARGHAGGGPGEGFNGAGLLVAEGSAQNVFAFNGATRCGYGALLLGPGVDGNLFYRNDFSHAVAQGLLALGGRGTWVVENELGGTLEGGLRALDAERWVIHGNTFADVPGAAISLEGSRACLVLGNRFEECDRAFQARPLPSAAPGASEAPASEGHWLLDNLFRENLQDLVLECTRGLVASGNRFQGAQHQVRLQDFFAEGREGLTAAQVWGWLAGPDGARPSGRAWRSSLRASGDGEHPAQREVRRFRAPALPGSARGSLPGAPPGLQGLVLGPYGPWDYDGPERRPSGSAPGGLLAGVTWDASWFRFDGRTDPRGDLEAWRALAFEPAHRARVRSWVDPWGDEEVRAQVGLRNFGLVATARVSLPEAGIYRFSILSDDGVRLFVGERMVYEDWTWHPARRDEVTLELGGGTHELRLEYFQLDGAAALALDLVRVGAAQDAQREIAEPLSEAPTPAAEPSGAGS